MILAGNLEYVEHLVNTVREALLMSTDIYFDVEQNSELEEPMRQVLTLVVEGFTVLPKSKQDNYPHGKAANIYKAKAVVPDGEADGFNRSRKQSPRYHSGALEHAT